MIMRKLFAASALALTAGVVQAEMINASGVGMGEGQNKVMPLSEGLVVVEAHSTYTGFETEDPNNPLSGATGPCFGSMIIKAGQVSGGGNCHYTDADGDQVVMGWKAMGMTAEGFTTGEWTIEGGIGKWDGARGGGTFVAGTDANGVYSNTVTGEMMMP